MTATELNQLNQIHEMINYTNQRIGSWYVNAKKDFGVKGSGKAHYSKENNEVVVEYTENGVQSTWKMAYYPEYIKEQSINWVYNCWSELA